MDDVLLNKMASVERCLKRINEEYTDFESFKNNQTKQDAIILNLQRAIEIVIDMGARVVRIKHLGIPQSTRDVFVFLEKEQIVSAELSHRMQKMVGFRNIAIHDYSAINLEIVSSIIKHHLTDILDMSQILLKV